MSESLWLLFPPAFVAIWLLTCVTIARVGGWRALAESYPAQGPLTATGMPGRRFRWRSLSLRWGTNYNGCIELVASPVVEMRKLEARDEES